MKQRMTIIGKYGNGMELDAPTDLIPTRIMRFARDVTKDHEVLFFHIDETSISSRYINNEILNRIQ